MNCEKGRDRNTEYKRSHPNCVKDWRYDHPEKSRGYSSKFHYGLTSQDIFSLWVKQNGICPICEDALFPTTEIKEKHGTKGWMVVDHIERNNKIIIRGLIHGDCNTAIGFLDNNPLTCQRAFEYLIRSEVE